MELSATREGTNKQFLLGHKFGRIFLKCRIFDFAEKWQKPNENKKKNTLKCV